RRTRLPRTRLVVRRARARVQAQPVRSRRPERRRPGPRRRRIRRPDPRAAMTTDAVYPPDHHLLRDLALEIEHRHDGTSRGWLSVVPALLDDTGAVRAGVLATIVDMIGGGLAAQTAVPNWIATADLTLHVARRATGPTIETIGRVLRAGRTTIVLD